MWEGKEGFQLLISEPIFQIYLANFGEQSMKANKQQQIDVQKCQTYVLVIQKQQEFVFTL